MIELLNKDDVIAVIRNTISPGALQDTLEIRVNSLDAIGMDTSKGCCPNMIMIERRSKTWNTKDLK